MATPAKKQKTAAEEWAEFKFTPFVKKAKDERQSYVSFRHWLSWGRAYRKKYSKEQLAKIAGFITAGRSSSKPNIIQRCDCRGYNDRGDRLLECPNHNRLRTASFKFCGGCHGPMYTARFSLETKAAFPGMQCPACGQCDTCCKRNNVCAPCAGCSFPSRVENHCPVCNCGRGNACGCCNCRYCVTCGVIEATRCTECVNCETHCRCVTIQHFDGPEKPHFHNPTPKMGMLLQMRKNRSNRSIAAEIEVSGIKIPKNGKLISSVVKKWGGGIVHDGSLPKGGFEINTAPASGDLYVQQITEICDSIKKAEGFITPHCGLHVHVDARDMNCMDIRNLIYTYAAIEPILYKMTHPSRSRSKYCLPCGTKYLGWVSADDKLPKIVRDKITTGIYGNPNTKESKKKKRVDARYNALNLHSFFFRQTVECRMFEGSIDPETIIAWGKMWALIMDFSKYKSLKEIIDTVPIRGGDLNRSKDNLLTVVKSDKSIQEFVEKQVKFYSTFQEKDNF